MTIYRRGNPPASAVVVDPPMFALRALPDLTRRKRWTPGPWAQVNWSHPLAANLKMYVMPGVSPRDLADGSNLTAAAGSVTRGGSTLGAIGVGTLARWSLPNVSRFSVPSSTGFSIFVAGQGQGSNDKQAFSTRAGNPIMNLTYMNGSIRFRTRNDATTLNDLDITCAINTQMICATATWASGAKALYADGATRVTASSSGSITGQTNAGLFGDDQAADTSNSSIVVAGFWTRALTASEVAMLHADPFCLLRF